MNGAQPDDDLRSHTSRMAADVSATRLYLGNLPRDVTKEDIQDHFKDGPGTISEIKLMSGFGFIEYEDKADASDVVPAFHGNTLKGNRLTVQFARGSRPREYLPVERHPHPRRTAFRMQISSLPEDTSWQDLKDFARKPGLDVVYSEISRDRDGRGFVEFENAGDLKTATEKLDGEDFKGSAVRCVADPQPDVPYARGYRHPRSRSPPRGGRGGPYPPMDGGYRDYRGPPHGYSPPRNGYDNYRRRSPPRHYDDPYAHPPRSYRSPPRVPPPVDDYPPPRGGGGGYGPRGADPYAHGPPPRRSDYADPYGGANGYDHRRHRSPPRGYAGGYDDRRGY